MSTSTPPPGGGPEFLEQGGGDPVGREPSGSSSGGRRTALVAGGSVLALGVVGGAAWAAMSFFSTGDQPTEALPAGTLGYAAVDLDPSGSQKIEALRMIKKFPGLDKELGGMDADDDLLAKVFEEADCEGLDYADDVQPWLGYRFAVAAVDLPDGPVPVGVLQVSDAGAADAGLARLAACDGGQEQMGWVVEGDWAVLAETEDIAQQVVDAAAGSTLADDADYQRWTDAVGEPGIMTMYVAPAAGEALAQYSDELGLLGPGMGPWFTPGGVGGLDDSEVTDEMAQALEDFEGMAATVRFSDGALELEGVAAAGDRAQLLATDRGDDALATLPADTAVALGFGFADGWLDALIEQALASTGEGFTPEDIEEQLQAATGVTLDDLETAMGESAALALGSDLDPDAIFGSGDGSNIPVGAKIKGDAGAIEGVFGKLAQAAGPEAGFLGTDSEGDFVVVGPNPGYRAALLGDGGLGDTAAYQGVVRNSDEASAVLYVNFDANDWLTGLAEGQGEVRANLEPLEALGVSSWTDDGVTHGLVRLTTE